MDQTTGRARSRIRVEGIVQGVGFRPFLFSLAGQLGLAGFVGNDAAGVFVEVEGTTEAVARFLATLEDEPPPLAVVEKVVAEAISPRGDEGFEIVESARGGERQTLISPDTGTCDDCLRELFDPADRRCRYPFINCTNCGPRFTIIQDVPYDRRRTTMAEFEMCDACAREYRDPADRRFHAQPVCCPRCGPVLRLADPAGASMPGDPLGRTAMLLRSESVVAIKGLGGYHLATIAASERATETLRSRKYREDKPFAVMVPDIDAARALCLVDNHEERLLCGPRRPIVLLERRDDDVDARTVASAVAPGNRSLGVMLPYTPLHHLLLADLAAPVVLTSGNVSDEPIAFLDEEAFERLGAIADAFLVHDRPIHTRTDDSVTRVFGGRAMPVRRARGYAPQPVTLTRAVRQPILACGAELKSTFCLAKGRYAFVSHHIGDLENLETYRAFREGVELFSRLFEADPRVVAHDLHPEYLSTKYATELEDVRLVGVQHHHAHVVSCLTDNGEDGPAIGVAFDGLGFGIDGTIWGGEFLVADARGFERAGHFEAVAMPGGAAAIREPWRMAAAYLDAAGLGGSAVTGADEALGLAVASRHEDRWQDVVQVARSGVSSPLTSSAGRLFDAVSAVLGVRDRVHYEGQAAIELEQRADRTERGSYHAALVGDAPFRVQGADLLRSVTTDLVAGVDVATIAGRFHNGVALTTLRACERIRATSGLSTVALSGGVFQNLLLLHRTVEELERAGFRPLVHSHVPPNDGGISLGQVAVAAAADD